MRLTRLIIIGCVLFALIVPLQAVAQTSEPSNYYGTVAGMVYSAAFPVSGATVTLSTYDPVGKIEMSAITSTTTDSRGGFSFPYVVFQTGKQFQYIVRADRGSSTAMALVYSYPAKDDVPVYVAPITLDVSTPSMYSSVTVNVFSTATSADKPVPVPGATLTLYSVDLNSGNLTQIGQPATTDSNGQYTYGSLPYGMYVVRAEKSGLYKEQQFAAYQQAVNNVNLNTDLAVPSPTPTPSPTATPGKSSATPGFEAAAALIALLGAALYLRRA